MYSLESFYLLVVLIHLTLSLGWALPSPRDVSSTTQAPYKTNATLPEQVEDNGDDDDADDGKGESRKAKFRTPARDGTPTTNKNHPWLGTAWIHGHPEENGKINPKLPTQTIPRDGFMAGHSIALPGQRHLLHHDTFKVMHDHKAEISLHDHKLTDANAHTWAWAQHPTPDRIENVHAGPSDKWGISKPVKLADLGNSSFGIYGHKLDPMKRNPYPNEKDPAPLPGFKLEHNKNNFGDNCHAHAWGFQDPHFGRRAEPIHDFIPMDKEGLLAPKERQRMTFPVAAPLPKHCNSVGLCDMLSKGATFCPGKGDLGAPILCGREQKLTYLVHSSSDSGACTNKFKAQHVGHLYDHIKQYDASLVG